LAWQRLRAFDCGWHLKNSDPARRAKGCSWKDFRLSKEFELARLHMIRAAQAGEIDQVRGYAWAHRIYPLNPDALEEAFKDDFTVGRDEREEVLLAMEEGWRKKKPVSFYDLEGFRDRQEGLDRMEIYHVCRLAFLDGRFHETVWEALTVPGSGPIETQGMTDEFNMQDDINY
jgi:hypothetical protein